MKKYVDFNLMAFYSTESCQNLIEFSHNLTNCHSQNYHNISKRINQRISDLHEEIINALGDFHNKPESELSDYQKKKKQEFENSYCTFMEEKFGEIVYPESILNQFVLMQHENLWIHIPSKIFRFNADYLCGEDENYSNQHYGIDWLEQQLKRQYEIEIFKVIPINQDDEQWQFIVIDSKESDKLHELHDWLEFIETDGSEVATHRPYINW